MTLRKVIFSFILSPTSWIYWLVIALLFILKIPIWVIVAVAIGFVIFFNFLPYYLIKKLESKFQVVQETHFSEEGHILVLGGGHIADSELVFEQQLNNTSLRRVLEGVRLANYHESSLLIMSGHSLRKGHPSQAEIQAEVAVTMGIDRKSLKIISEPSNTEEEAFFYFKNYSIHKKPIFLVTKAIHLKRACFIFSSYGYNIIPSPSYFLYKNYHPSFSWFLIPDFNLVINFSEYLKEFVGYMVLKIKISYKKNLKLFYKYKINEYLLDNKFDN